MKQKYIEAINRLANETDDIELLDFIYRLFVKCGKAVAVV